MVTVYEYMSMDADQRQDYDFIIRYSRELTKPIDKFNFGSVTEMTAGTVKDIQDMIEKGTFGLYNYAINFIDLHGFSCMDKDIFDFIHAYNYICSEVIKLLEIEAQLLVCKSIGNGNDDESKGLEELAIYIQFRTIAMAFGVLPREVRKLTYSEFFTELFTQVQLTNMMNAKLQNKKSLYD